MNISRQQPPCSLLSGNIHRLGVKRIATLAIARTVKSFESMLEVSGRNT